MKIRLAAIDSKMVNVAILKIAQYHINIGDQVKWYEPLFDLNIDKLYISKIFSFSEDLNYLPQCKIIKGGTGYDIKSKLDDEIENITDVRKAYELLYPNCDYSIQFTTRGCVRNCNFCLVRQKEGLIYDVPMLTLNPNGKYIKVMDNNFFSSETWKTRLDNLKSYNQYLDFNQGIDIRTITEEQAKALGECKIKRIHIAWDNINDEVQVLKGIEILTKYIKSYKLNCYVLVGFKSARILEEDLYRVKKLDSMGIDPFAMGYIDYNNSKFKKTKQIKDFCRYVNHKAIFRTCEWNEYN
jgi:hypothetical protein